MNIGYARVSTHEQNPELQIDALNAAGCETIFVERASGAAHDRPKLEAALNYLRPGDALVIWRLDRLARSMPQLLRTVEALEAKGAELKSLNENLDTGTPGGRLLFHIFGALAEFERGIIRERTLAGLKAARERGRVGGRPRSLSEDDVVAAKALLSEQKLTVANVAERLGVSVSTIYNYIPAARSSALSSRPRHWMTARPT